MTPSSADSGPLTGGPWLDRAFFARPTVEVARDLIGCRLVIDRGTADHVEATIVETEAYLGVEDPASHAFRGPTPRSAIMFGPAGHVYVYISYGMHHCMNLVTETDGVAGAVLIRSAAVDVGDETVSARRGATRRDHLLRGPGNLCRGLGITLSDGGMDVAKPRSRMRCENRSETSRPPIVASPRVGISHAVDRPLRFVWAGHPAVTHGPRRTGQPLATERKVTERKLNKKRVGSRRPSMVFCR